MRTSTVVRIAGGLLGLALLSPTSAAGADEVDPLAPVVADDSPTLWPGEYQDINVLTNDSDPNGDGLTVCWLPPLFDGPHDDPPVTVHDRTVFGEHPRGTLAVSVSPDATGVHTVDY